MSAFHELALYNFLNYLANMREDMEEFDDIYFDDKCHSLIDEATTLYAVWPGKWSSDLFIIDDLDGFAKAFNFI